MWKKLIGTAAIFIVASLAYAQQADKPAASSGAAPGDETETVKKLIYVVQPNDTLWDISRRFLNSPYYWPKIWERNQFIINPKLIYPGDVINLYPESEKLTPPVVETVPKIGEEKPGVTGPGEETKVVLDESGRVKKVTYQEVAATGWIEAGVLEKAGKILKMNEGHNYGGTWDHVFINVGSSSALKEGDIFSVFEVSHQVRDPVTHRKIGYKIFNNGEIKIVKLTPGAAEAEIVHSYYEMEPGDFIRPYVPPLSTEVSVITINKKAEGMIVDNRRDTPSFAQNDIVYINLGKKDGIENGAILEAYLPGERFTSGSKLTKKKTKTVLPDKIIGNVVVLDAREKTSVGMVTYSVQEFKIGERVRLPEIK